MKTLFMAQNCIKDLLCAIEKDNREEHIIIFQCIYFDSKLRMKSVKSFILYQPIIELRYSAYC